MRQCFHPPPSLLVHIPGKSSRPLSVAVLNLADRILSFTGLSLISARCASLDRISCSMFIISSRIDDLVSLYPVFLCPSPMCFSQSDDIPSQPSQLFHQYSRCSRRK